MQKLPKISIITPSYNQGQFIEETILSVLGQQYENLEYILIDGGSNDNTIDIIKNYENQISYWISEKDSGQSEAINKGFAKASGDIVMWLNSDDVLMPGILNKISSYFHNDFPCLWFGNCIMFSEEKGVSSSGSNLVFASKTYQLEDTDYIIQPSSLWNRKALEIVGGVNEELYYTMDWEWYLRAKNSGVAFLAIEHCISMYRIHAAHKSSNGSTKRQDEIAIIYQRFNSLKAELYFKLRNESMLTTKNWVIRLLIKVFKKWSIYNRELVLKFFKYNKYKNYTLVEMQAFCGML